MVRLTKIQVWRTLWWFNRKRYNKMEEYHKEGRTLWAAHECARKKNDEERSNIQK